MSNQYRYTKGKKLGSWELLRPLGKGGNAEVWKARRPGGRIMALKILNTINPRREPYKRFRTEVEFLRSLGDQPGVLPIIDASLPKHPSRNSPAWLAMPVATSIRQALGESPGISAVVEAIAAIAETLASLATKKIAHRDIKPANLYCLNRQWAIGDFGLVDYPKKETVTADGKTLGPLYFMAPEMITNPGGANGCRADVYSLAKTLWVLATGQRYPPQGEQRVDVLPVTLKHYIDHFKVRILDRLIERATKHNPEERPEMADIASELRAWLAPTTEPVDPRDVSDVVARIVAAAEPGSRADKRRGQNIADATEYLERFRSPLKNIALEIAKTGLSDGEISEAGYIFHCPGVSGYNFEISKRTGSEIGTSIIWSQGLGVKAKETGRIRAYPYEMTAGVQVFLFEDEILEVVGGYDFVVVTLPPGLKDWGLLYAHHAPVSSARLEQKASSVIGGMFKGLRPALEYFAKLLESRRP